MKFKLVESITEYVKQYFSYKDHVYGPEDCFIGYGNDYTWNGWAMPAFEFDVATEIVKAANEEIGSEVLSYDKSTDTFTFINSDGIQDTYEGHNIATTDGTKHVYDIGSGNWSWLSFPLDAFNDEEFFDDEV